MLPTIKFYTEQILNPDAKDVLKAATRIVYPNGARYQKTDPAPGVIHFGGSANGAYRSISPAQMATQPSAVSYITRALELQRDGAYTGRDRMQRETITHPSQLEQFFDKYVAVDLEWDKAGNILCIGLCVAGEKTYIVPEPKEKLTDYVKILATYNYLIGHNWKADANALYEQTGIAVPVWFDTMVAHHSLHMASTGHHDLKSIAETMLGVPDWDDEIKDLAGRGKNADYGRIPRDILYEYNRLDVLYTLEIASRLMPLVTDYYWLTHGLKANALLYVEQNRIAIDLEYVQALYEELQQGMEEQLELLPEGINPNSPKQLLEYFQAEGLSIKSTGADVLAKHADHPAVKPLLEYRRLAKQANTYCKSYIENQVDGKLKPNFNVHGTSTGRLSSSQPSNFQNIPRDHKIKRIFTHTGKDDRVAQVDYSQAELRVMACLSDDKGMQSLFQEDSPDFFDALQPRVFPKLFPDLDAFYTHKEQEPEDATNKRALLKGIVYGLSYGRGAVAIAEASGNTPQYAQGIIDMFLESFPMYALWRKQVVYAALAPQARDFLITPFGAQFESEVITPRNKQTVINAALAFLPQSTAGDMTTIAAIRSNDILRKRKINVRINNLVHDAIYLDGHKDEIGEATQIVQHQMRRIGEEVFGDAVVFATSAEIGSYWSDFE